MKRFIPILFLVAAVSLASCQKELAGDALYDGMGRIEIALAAGDGVFITEETKAGDSDPSIEDVVFTISGTTAQGAQVVGQPLDIVQRETTACCYFMAGTYTITAVYAPSDAEEGIGALCYSGTSEEFMVDVAGNTGAIPILMEPSNSRVNIVFDSSLKEFYSSVSVGFTSPRSVSFSSSDVGSDGRLTVYLPSGAAGVYGITATRLSGSGSADIGITGLRLPALKDGEQPLLLEAGKEYIIKVKFAPGGIAVFLDGDSAPVYTSEETWDGLFS